ncbi:MAG: alpha-amylase family glycosyl hydrolase [Elusimicrobiota bacterium]
MRRAHSAGMKVVLDFIPNHTSMDSKLLFEDPAYFIHREADPSRPRSPPYGAFDHDAHGRTLWISHGGYDNNGTKDYWVDTAQVNYANPAMRRRMTGIVKGWVRRFGVDGFRVDMAYQVLNGYFSRNWGLRMPQREFLEEMITEVRSEYPGTGFIAEAYDGWDALSASGFDLIYGKNNVNRPGGHHGWYDALQSRDPGWIREAVRRAAFLRWQKGGSDTMDFTGNHDEASPKRAFGPWERGASFLTLMMPGATLFYGSQEIGFDKPNLEKEPKSLPFSVPVKVDWEAADPGLKSFYRSTFEAARSLHASLGEADIEALDGAAQGWAGYALLSRGQGRKAVVLANPSDRPVRVDISRPDLGLEHHGELQPYAHALLRY